MHAGHDIVIRGGTIYDGSGGTPFAADVAIDGDRIAAIGDVNERGRAEIDAAGLAVAPGFWGASYSARRAATARLSYQCR